MSDHDSVLDALEPIADCLTVGPLTRESLYLAGETELPGALSAPVDGAGRADRLRSALTLLGVPFERLATHAIDSDHVEVGVAPSTS
jgi:hypothetical protein